MKDIHSARGYITDIVGSSVIETFNTMFGQNVSRNLKEPLHAPNNVVLSCIRLIQKKTEVDFVFRFDMNLLLQAAALIFTQEYIETNPVHEDLACEIANIVCAKVKSSLNDEGYDIEMGFPFVPKADEAARLAQDKVVHMHFFYQDKLEKQGVGVAVNFTVA